MLNSMFLDLKINSPHSKGVVFDVPFSMFQVTYLNHVLEIWWFFKKIEHILGIKNLKKIWF